ncbi:MAG: MEKHLA domain-containing protein [Nitrospirota bacterium]
MMGEQWNEPPVVAWCQLLLDSFRRWTGRELIERTGPAETQAAALFHAPFVLVSHGTGTDPVLNYGNRAALDLWEMDWERFTRTPSRFTAEPVNQAERARMLAKAAARGVIHDYRGVRISGSGRRFLVEDAVVWNVTDAEGTKRGQAATFSKWKLLDEP